jgi:hypothetical protein
MERREEGGRSGYHLLTTTEHRDARERTPDRTHTKSATQDRTPFPLFVCLVFWKAAGGRPGGREAQKGASRDLARWGVAEWQSTEHRAQSPCAAVPPLPGLQLRHSRHCEFNFRLFLSAVSP